MTVRKVHSEKKPKARRVLPKRVFAALARMRNRNESLTKAARAVHTTPRTVRTFAGKRLRRSASGRYLLMSHRIKREIYVFGAEGYEPVTVGTFKQARLASQHLIAINAFLRAGDTKQLKRFSGKRIAGVKLLTDTKRIREFADADLVKLDGLYRDQRGHGRRK